MLKKICFSCQINLTIGERPNKKNIESLNFAQKVNLLRLWREKKTFVGAFEKTQKHAYTFINNLWNFVKTYHNYICGKILLILFCLKLLLKIDLDNFDWRWTIYFFFFNVWCITKIITKLIPFKLFLFLMLKVKLYISLYLHFLSISLLWKIYFCLRFGLAKGNW